MKTYGLDDLAHIMQHSRSNQPRYATIHVFRKGFKKRLGTVVSKEWPFKLTPDELRSRFDATYHVPNMDGRTWTGWTSDAGLER